MIERAPSPPVSMTYDEAAMYCFFLSHNGHRDWRLPTLEELSNIVKGPAFLHYHYVIRQLTTTKFHVIPVRTLYDTI